jgi:hypothetical protein
VPKELDAVGWRLDAGDYGSRKVVQSSASPAGRTTSPGIRILLFRDLTRFWLAMDAMGLISISGLPNRVTRTGRFVL